MAAIPERLVAALADRYRLERELGAGGMATVYLAEDLKHHRRVAVKVLRPDLAVTLGADRFLREIGIAARLSHPHILPLHDSGEADGFLYYVMPYVEGTSLRQKLAREGELPVPEAVRILHDLADAMAHAHAQGIVHRDIKPENVMLTGRHAVVTDFGVAKALGEAQSSGTSSRTSAGVALGTPAYMAPEQATGDAHVDARADLYAWGVVAYELLAGQPPFVRATPQNTLAAQATATPEPVTAHRANLPGLLTTLVMQCLEKRPADRPQTAAELVTRLEAVLTPSGGMTPTDTQPYVTAAARRVRRRTRLITTGMAVVAVVASGAAWRLRSGAPAPPVVVRQMAVTTDPGLEVEPALSPDGRFVAYTTGPLVRSRVKVRQVASGDALHLTTDSAGAERFPQWTSNGARIAFLARGTVWTAPALGGQPTALLTSGTGQTIVDFSISNGGDRIAVVRMGQGMRTELAIVSLEGGADAADLVLGGIDHSPSQGFARPVWSGDDRWIAVVRGGREYSQGTGQFGNLAPASIWLVSSDGASRHAVTDSLTMNVSPGWGPGGRSLVFVSNRGGGRDLYSLALDGAMRPAGAALRMTTGAAPHSVAVSGGGTTLVYSSYAPRTTVWRVRIPPAGEARLEDAEQLTFENAVIETMNVTADGRWLYYDAARDGSADLFRMRIGTRQPERLAEHPADDFMPELSPDGRLLVFQSHRQGTRDLFLMDSAGGPARPLVAGPGHQNYPRWSPDGRWIVFWTTPGVAVIERDSRGAWGGPVQLLDVGGVPSWSSDGTRVLLANGRAIVRVDPASRAVDTLHLADQAVDRPIMPRDGRSIYYRMQTPTPGSVWAIPAAGGKPRLVLRFEPGRESNRAEYFTDGRHLYFTLDDRQADLWALELAPPRR
ncbi:MAG TPA: protein kinase [Gemmatimonadales bacterium]